MAFDQKISKMADDVVSALQIEGLTVSQSYDASNDLYLTVTDPAVNGASAILKFEKVAQTAPNAINFVTGLSSDIYTPHVTKVGFATLAHGTGTAKILPTLAVGDKITIDGHDFLCVNSGAVLDQWNIAGTQSSGTAEVLANLMAGNALTVNGHSFTAMDSGAAGDQFDVSGVAATATATLGAALTAGDKVTLAGNDFTSIDVGAAGNQWNITGTNSAATALIGPNLTAGDKITLAGHDFVSVDAGAAGDQWNITGTYGSATATIGAALTAGDKITVNGHDFLSMDSGAAGDQWNITGTFGAATATIAAGLTAGDKVTLAGHDFVSVDSGAAGDQWNITGTASAATATVATNLTAGDKITLAGHDFIAVDSGAAGDQWNITGTQAASTVVVTGAVNTDTVIINGVTITATVATQDDTNYIVNANDVISATNLCTTITANAALSALVTATNVAGTSATITITAKLKGTSGNAFTTVDGIAGHHVCANATLINGAVNLPSCAISLAAAITASVTVGVAGIVDAVQDGVTVEQVNIFGTKKGTSGNITLTTSGANIVVSGNVVGGAVTLASCATALATAINDSATVGIAGLVGAVPDGVITEQVNITAEIKGTSGNLTLTTSGANVVISGNLIGGAVTLGACAVSLAAAITNSVTVGIDGVVDAAQDGGVPAQVNVTAVKKGTTGNVTMTTSGANIVVSGNLIGGAVTEATCAISLAAAITNSVTVGIDGVVDAAQDGVTPAQVDIAGTKKGTSGNITLATSGANIAVSGNVTGGAVNLSACAVSLAAAITGSVTVGIDGVVDAAQNGVVPAQVDITGTHLGTSGNITLATSGANIAISGNVTGGLISRDLTAAALVAAVEASVTVGVANVVTASAPVGSAIVTITSDNKGVAGDAITMAQTGANFTLSDAHLNGGTVVVNTCAAALNAAILGSVTVGIAGVVTSTVLTDTVTITAIDGGPAVITFTQTGGHITVSGAGVLVGGGILSTSNLTRMKTMAMAQHIGTSLKVYEKPTAVVVTDLATDTYMVWEYRGQYGNLMAS